MLQKKEAHFSSGLAHFVRPSLRGGCFHRNNLLLRNRVVFLYRPYESKLSTLYTKKNNPDFRRGCFSERKTGFKPATPSLEG